MFVSQADQRYLLGPYLHINADGLEQSTLGLKFRVQQHHFHRGDLKLKCLATIFSVYWKSNEESVEPDKQQRAPALESRESRAPPDKSRADRVHGERPAVVSQQAGTLKCDFCSAGADLFRDILKVY